MKKTYIQPSITEVKTAIATIMAGSETIPNNPTGQATEWGVRQSGWPNGRSVWDDDEE